MSRIGLVLEGGSFRGIFTAGVLDLLLEHHISFPYVIGVSAGSGNAVNFIAGQEGRTKKVITHENADAYYGLGTLRNNGKVLDLDQMLAYDKEPLNFDSFFASDVEREFVAVNCETGKAEYLTDDGTAESILQICKASCSVPLMCAPVKIGGNAYLDGSIVDSIPYERAFERGCDKVVVVQTRKAGEAPTDYSKMKLLLNVCYHSTYPKVAEVMVERRYNYDKQIRRLEELEQDGKAIIIRPEIGSIGHFENDVEKINDFYKHGYELMEKNMGKLQEFIKS